MSQVLLGAPDRESTARQKIEMVMFLTDRSLRQPKSWTKLFRATTQSSARPDFARKELKKSSEKQSPRSRNRRKRARLSMRVMDRVENRESEAVRLCQSRAKRERETLRPTASAFQDHWWQKTQGANSLTSSFIVPVQPLRIC